LNKINQSSGSNNVTTHARTRAHTHTHTHTHMLIVKFREPFSYH